MFPQGWPPPGEPDDWAKVKEISDVEVVGDGTHAWRKYICTVRDLSKDTFTESFWPVYVPTPPSESAGGQGGNNDESKVSGGASAVAEADKYWAVAASQARSTAKWIATSLGAALAVIIGTAPLTPLGGEDVDWPSAPGVAIAVGMGLLGVTFFMVVSVLVPGITFLADLNKSKDNRLNQDRSWADHLVVSSGQRALGRRAATDHGVLLPIGITSVDELGHRIRLDEMTLDRVAEKLADAPAGNAGEAERKFWTLVNRDRGKLLRQFWTQVKLDRGRMLQSYIDEATQWVILASYVAVKVLADRARSIGLALGLVGAALVVWGYIAIQPSEAEPTADEATYVVLTVNPTSTTRSTMGADCDTFTGVSLRDAPAGTLAIYVTEGEGCTTGRVEVPAGDVGTVVSASNAASTTASTSPLPPSGPSP